MVGKPQIFGLRVGSSLPFFKVRPLHGRAEPGIYGLPSKYQIRVLSSLKPTFFLSKFSLRAGLGPAKKFALDEQAGGPSLGLNTPLIPTLQK